MLEQQKTMRKDFFFLGSEQRCHRLGSDKNGILVESGRFTEQA